MRPQTPVALVLCSHNPEPRSLQRCLSSLQNLLAANPALELVLVDNNSTPPLAQAPPVQKLLRAHPWASLVEESRQGLCWARRRGVESCSSRWVVFVDDDNELAPDYLDILRKGIERHPDVAAWGPGVIDVEFLDPVPAEIEAHPEWFQQRREPLAYGCQPGTWQPYYPNGSGFAIRRDVLDRYGSRLNAGTLTATGRSGNSMASAEDIQIVWEAIRLESAAGLLPDLRLVHLIPGEKTSPGAIARLSFGLSSSYYPALLESWPEKAGYIPAPPSYAAFLQGLVKLRLKRMLRPRQRYQAIRDLGFHVGFACGLTYVHGDPQHPRTLRWAERLGMR